MRHVLSSEPEAIRALKREVLLYKSPLGLMYRGQGILPSDGPAREFHGSSMLFFAPSYHKVAHCCVRYRERPANQEQREGEDSDDGRERKRYGEAANLGGVLLAEKKARVATGAIGGGVALPLR